MANRPAPALTKPEVAGRDWMCVQRYADAKTAVAVSGRSSWSAILPARPCLAFAVGVSLRALSRLPVAIAVDAQDTEPTDAPLMLAGGEHVIGPVLPRLHEILCAHDGWSDVQVDIVAGARH